MLRTWRSHRRIAGSSMLWFLAWSEFWLVSLQCGCAPHCFSLLARQHCLAWPQVWRAVSLFLCGSESSPLCFACWVPLRYDYNGYRWYAAVSGSHSSPDAFHPGITAALYAYALARPTRLIDRLGLFSIDKSCDNMECLPPSGDAHLCPGNWTYGVPQGYLADLVLHEWAHNCGWSHGEGKGVPCNSGECTY